MCCKSMKGVTKNKEAVSMAAEKSFSMEELMAYCSQYGFIFQGSEIYGGLANTWDYGPLGTRLKNNIKDAWKFPLRMRFVLA